MNTKKRRKKNKKTSKAGSGRIGMDSHNHDIDINRIVSEVTGIASHARETLRRCANEKEYAKCNEGLKLRIQVGVEDLNTIKQVLRPLENLIQS